ncbi:MAG: hypothetical protein WC256_12065 [Desulfurivibrionaceae bacterium]
MTSEESTWAGIIVPLISGIIEDMAFTEVMPSEATPQYDLAARGASLLVHDPVQGEFQLIIENSLLKYLAGIVYGPMADELNEQSEGDFLDELLNTIAGRFLSVILPEDKSFTLGIPERFSGPFVVPVPPVSSWSFVIEGMCFTLIATGESLVALENR